MRTDFKNQGNAPVEHQQAYALKVIANTLEDIRDVLQEMNNQQARGHPGEEPHALD